MHTLQQQRWTTLLILLLWTSTTATALSLSNFQLITSSAVPIPCILSYNSQITGCTTRDFIRGNFCSSECVRGLTKIQTDLQDVCTDARVSGTSVLGQVLLGNLVGLLCPGGTVRPPTTTSARVVSPTTTRSLLTFTTVRTATTTSASPPTSTEEVEDTTTSSSSSTTTEEVVRTPTDVPTFVQSEVVTTTTTSSSTSTSVAAPEATNEPGLVPGSGGGSPFDFAVRSSGAMRSSMASDWVIGAVVLGMSLMMVLH
ncbi:hypothetical protein QBC38DRAFT_287823 [Podospora fimiseda]|uniref:Extracellular membrane protein CFEM domain-containing protein n=1 Tax=Podospora fimiseda TaxID=252190 RepID=A0AAN7GQS0_9PEZI|nr:hypothetical protein QBC38DRAFT_287823 [Podospora fimiseda]